MNHISDAARSTKGNSLPYGMFLTLFFKHFNVSLENEEGEVVLNVMTGRRNPPPRVARGRANDKGKGVLNDNEEGGAEEESSPKSFFKKSETSSSKGSKRKTSSLKSIMRELVTELSSFTELQRSLLSIHSKKSADAEKRLKHFKERWSMLEKRIEDVASSDFEAIAISNEDDDPNFTV